RDRRQRQGGAGQRVPSQPLGETTGDGDRRVAGDGQTADVDDRRILPGRSPLAEVQARDQTEIGGGKQGRRGRRERQVDDRPRQYDRRPGRSAVRREQVYSPGGVRDRERAAEGVERDGDRPTVQAMLP